MRLPAVSWYKCWPMLVTFLKVCHLQLSECVNEGADSKSPSLVSLEPLKRCSYLTNIRVVRQC